MNVLIAEDDKNILNALTDILEQEGYAVVSAENGVVALELFKQASPDFILLDIMMPGKDGYTVCREIRAENNDVPVVFISAKSEEIDRVVGLELGADDYIMKPFGAKEVVARIRAITRRVKRANAPTANEPESEFMMADLMVYPDQLRARRGEQSFDLSLRDVAILALLYRCRGKVVTRDVLFDECWGRNYLPSSRTLDQHISKLRKVIEHDPATPQIVKTVHGVGYRFD